MPKIISYNVNGIRAAMRKGLDQWLQVVDADIVCLQEIKAKEDQIDVSIFHDLGYECFWYSAQKPGYSGTAILSRINPDHVEYYQSRLRRYFCNQRLYALRKQWR